MHAHDVWPAFHDLSLALLGERGELLLSFRDDEPKHVAEASVAAILDVLKPHADQLSHDGYIQFGIVCQDDLSVREVLVEPFKNFKVWFNDERAFAAQMRSYGLVRAERLEFIDEYPRVTARLADGRALMAEELERRLVSQLTEAN